MLAAASDAIIIGFNVRPLADARRAAEQEGVEIRTYSVIYKVTDELRAAMEGMLEAVEVEETLGQAEVKQTFKASRVGMIAGCEVTDGKVVRDGEVRLIRDGTVVWTGKIGSLRRFKDDVSEVENGLECGIVLEGFADIKVDDVLEIFKTKQVEQTLDSSGVPSLRAPLRLPDRGAPPLRRVARPEGQAQGAEVAQGGAAAPVRRRGRRDRGPRHLAADDAPDRAGGRRRGRRPRGRGPALRRVALPGRLQPSTARCAPSTTSATEASTARHRADAWRTSARALCSEGHGHRAHEARQRGHARGDRGLDLDRARGSSHRVRDRDGRRDKPRPALGAGLRERARRRGRARGDAEGARLRARRPAGGGRAPDPDEANARR